MDTTQQQDANDAGCPQRDQREDSTAEAAHASRVVITGINLPSRHPDQRANLTDFPSVGERQVLMPGHGNHAVLLHHPIAKPTAPLDAAIIDWFACTLTLSEAYSLGALQADLRRLFAIESFIRANKGWCGYHQRADLGGFGLLAWDGPHQRDTAHLSLNAHGCARVPDWHAVATWGESRSARISRLDLAHDDYSGQVWNADRLRREYLGDGFTGNDGRKPKSSLVGDWDNADKGRTYYVGSRTAGKMLRGYEKGKQLGEPDNPWYRLELELRGTNRVLGWEILTQPGRYLAGAYPCLASLSASPRSLETAVKSASIDYRRTLAHLKKQWGQFITLVHAVEGGDADVAIEALSREGFPARFLPQLPLLLSEVSDANADTD